MTKDEVMAEATVDGKKIQLMFVSGRRFSVAINGRNERWFLNLHDAKDCFNKIVGISNDKG